MFRKLSIIIVIVLVSFQMQGQILYDKQDSLIFEKYIDQMTSYKGESANDLMIRTAKFFIGKPYVAQTLEQADKESLIVNLREFDCTTFVESCISLVRTLKSENPTFKSYTANLQQLRYRNGHIEDYTSRLHYMSDWIYENEKAEILDDITNTLDGVSMVKKVDFMSTHSDLYPHLNKNQNSIDKIKKIEGTITQRHDYVVIPTNKIQAEENDINNGDIVVFATKIDGLDYSHVGIAVREKNSLSFIHASSSKKRIIFEPQKLHMYCRSSKGCIGITVLRVKSISYDQE